MIKQPLLPLKWYNEAEEQQFRNLMDTTGNDRIILRTDTTMILPFQIKRDNRPNIIFQWDLVNYDTGAVVNLNIDYLDIKSATVGGTIYNWIVMDARPIYPEQEEGFYYYIISDDVETWYSEVFEVCDLYVNLLTSLTNMGGVTGFDSLSVTFAHKRMYAHLCENTGNEGIAYSNTFDVIYNEPLDIFIYNTIGTVACAYALYGDDIKYELREDGTGDVISNTVQPIYSAVHSGGFICSQLIPTRTTTARLYVYIDNGEQVWQKTRVYLWPRHLDNHSIVCWKDSINFCDIIYVDSFDEDGCDYENYLILPKVGTVNPTYVIEEDSVESDQKETLPLIQSAQKFYKMEFAGGQYLADAISLIRLHDDVDIYLETGEILDICDFSMNNTPINDYCERIELTFREEACAKDNCDNYTLTECCCPTEEEVLDEEAGGVGALPACGAGTDGDRYLVQVAGTYHIYECQNGVGWVLDADADVACKCVLNLDTDNSDVNDYPDMWWYDDIGGGFLSFGTFNIADNGGHEVIATCNTNWGVIGTCDDDCPELFFRLQYDNGGTWTDIGEAEYFGNGNAIIYEIGAGNYDFRCIVYQHNCEWYTWGDTNVNIL